MFGTEWCQRKRAGEACKAVQVPGQTNVAVRMSNVALDVRLLQRQASRTLDFCDFCPTLTLFSWQDYSLCTAAKEGL